MENAQRVCLVEQVIGPGIVQRQFVDWHVYSTGSLYHLARVADYRQRFQAQEIHLQQPEIAHRPHRVLGHHHAILVLFEGQQVDQRLIPNYHAGGMDRCVSRQVFEHKGCVYQFPRDFFSFVGLFQLG